jgi:predicted flap endonuclease-1-like 5' DNA nuclease
MIRTILAVLVGVVLAFAGVFFIIWVLWWLSKRSSREQDVAFIEIEAQPPEPEVEAPPVAPRARVEDQEQEPPAAPDALKRIEGIGPKFSKVLQDAGIETFAQLAAASPDQLTQILEAADPRLLRLADPATWPEQAALAAAGEWDALGALQGSLKGGRRM